MRCIGFSITLDQLVQKTLSLGHKIKLTKCILNFGKRICSGKEISKH